MNEPRRSCSLAATVKVIGPYQLDPQAATVVELGAEAFVLRGAVNLRLGAMVAFDFELPGHPKEINAIAKVVGPLEPVDEVLCEFMHLPMFERQLVRRWVATDPPPRPAVRNRVG